MTTLKLGFIGLGIMGTPMAAHVRAAGHTLYVHLRSAPPQALLDAGAVASSSGAQCSRQRSARLRIESRHRSSEIAAGLMGGLASSRILEVHGERMIKRTFNPSFRIALHQKI